jgi:hypothetical protein
MGCQCLTTRDANFRAKREATRSTVQTAAISQALPYSSGRFWCCPGSALITPIWTDSSLMASQFRMLLLLGVNAGRCHTVHRMTSDGNWRRAMAMGSIPLPCSSYPIRQELPSMTGQNLLAVGTLAVLGSHPCATPQPRSERHPEAD